MADKKKIKSKFGKGDATVVKNKKGKDVVLLNPHQKADKAAFELKTKIKYTNTGEPKQDGLTEVERAYRAGYVTASMDNIKAYGKKDKK